MILRRHLFLIVLCTCLLQHSIAVFTEDFKVYLTDVYGKDIANAMERIDMGPDKLGSFGGKKDENDTVTKQPIIFVHGITSNAGFWIPHFEWFSKKNYSSSELYATTYGDGLFGFAIKSQSNCDSVKQIRRLIESVYNYTESKTDIIAHSLGAAVSRKAILGGKCVDTNETLGDSLTFMIDTFISLAGVAYGAESCPIFLESCNEKNGFNCKSNFIHDINIPNDRYEGEYSYYIYSNDDLIIGKNCCGHFCPELKNATDKSEHSDQNHLTIVSKTIDIQFSMLKDHTVIKDNEKDPK